MNWLRSMGFNEALVPAKVFWIGSDHPFDLQEAYLRFRQKWHVNRQTAPSKLFISADSRYKLWVNGQYIARGPARSWPHAQCLDCLDISAHLQLGHNCLAIQVYQPGYSHFAYVHRGAAGLIAWLANDSETMLVTDQSWRTRRDFSFAEVVPRISIYGTGLEDRNLALDDDWQSLDYDDTDWSQARIVASPGGYPWSALQLRSLPILVERPVSICLLELRIGLVPAVSCADVHEDLRRGWADAQQISAEQLDTSIDGKGAGSKDWYIVGLFPGQAAYYLFDLGRDFIAQGWVEIEGACGEEYVVVSYAEKVIADQLVLSDPRTYCRVRLTDRFRLRYGNQHAQSYSLRGGRYLLFQIVGPSGRDLRVRFHATVSEYPLELSNSLETSDLALAKIIVLCEDTFRACLLDGFIDSTWRESSQWMGDALPQALIMASMSADTRPLRRVIEMAALGAYPDGILPSVLPGEVHAYTVTDYNFIWIELLSLDWKLNRDGDFVAAMWPTLVKILERFHQDCLTDQLITSQPGRRLFLDWSPISRREPNAVYNLHYLFALTTAAALARARNATLDADVFNLRERALRSAIRFAFWKDGVWWDDTERSTYSQVATALALLAGAVDTEEQPALLDALAARSLNLIDAHDSSRMVLASPFMHHYVFEALRQGGRSDEVIEIIRGRWGRWVEANCPTTWENWNVDFPDGSQCHAFSAHPRYHLAEIARERGGL